MVHFLAKDKDALIQKLDDMKQNDQAAYSGALAILNYIMESSKTNAATYIEEIVFNENTGHHEFRHVSLVERTKTITSFTGEFSFLDPFAEVPFEFGGKRYKSVFNAFWTQAIPPRMREEREYVASLPSRYAGNHVMGKKSLQRSEWMNTEYQLKVMEDILMAKFTSSDILRAKLINTDPYIIEYRPAKRHDTFWGIWQDEGMNHFGRLLMETRDKLK